MSSISSADRTEETSSSLNLYRSKVASAWFARLRMAEESSNTCRCPRTYKAIVRMDLLTDSTGNPAC